VLITGDARVERLLPAFVQAEARLSSGKTLRVVLVRKHHAGSSVGDDFA
jgi:hypothetical protein